MKPAKEQMELVEQALNEYEDSCGLPAVKSPCEKDELEKYLLMTRDQIEKLSSEDCGQIAYRLGQFAFYLQRLHNREHARLAWGNNKLNNTIATEINSFDKFMKHEVKVALIKQTNEFAKSVGKIISYTEQRIQRLNFIASSLKNLSDIMIANKRSKYVKS